jgi:hypothetical protein
VILTTINYMTKKTPQLTKGQIYDMIKRKRKFQTSWNEKILWVETSGKTDNSGDLISLKRRFYKIKCTAVSDRVLNCQPKIVILNNIPSLSYYYRGGGGEGWSVQQILFPPFRCSGPVEKFSGPVDSWCSQVLDQCSFGNIF